MRIALASDHAGFTLKGEIAALLHELGHETIDFGAPSTEHAGYLQLDLFKENASIYRLSATSGARRTAAVPAEAMIEDVRYRGENARYQSEVVRSYNASAVRMTGVLAPGETAELVVRLRRKKH